MSTQFAPELFIPKGITDVSFYERAFGAKENFRFTNDDASIHVVEMVIDGQTFHLHETGHNSAFVSPDDEHYPAVCIGLFCDDPDNYFDQAVTQGAIVLQPMKSHSYGYRQGMIRDPFGHIWQIQKRL